MASDKNLYLIAVVVIALGLSNSLIKKHLDWADDLSGRVDTVVSWASDHASDSELRLANGAERLVGSGESQIERSQFALARVESKLACEQSRIAQRQAEMIRVQSERARAVALDHVQRDLRQQQSDRIQILKRQATPNNHTI